MRLSTRLLLPLLATVSVVMLVFAAWAVRQREQTLTEQSHRETLAYAVALGLAIESAFRDPQPGQIQQIIDRISRERTIYGVLVYGPGAELLYVSDPLPASAAASSAVVQRVIATGETTTMRREIGARDVFSAVLPIHGAGGDVAGAFEVAQPLSFLEAQIRATRQRFMLNTITLLTALTIMSLWLVRQMVSRPLGRLVAAAHTLGRGNLGHRIDEGSGGGELDDVARAFNRMANHLQMANADLVQQAEERVALERRLRETEKLAALGNLAAGLAHEIAAPLHVIRGRTEMLLKRSSPETADERNLRIIIEQIGRITVIVRNLLDFARRREPHFHGIDLTAVIDSVIEFLDWELGRAGVTIERAGTDPLPLEGDADLLRQVFVNLLLNAIQALEPAGNGGRISVSSRVADGRVIVEVEDNGPGIDEHVLPRIFEPFVTTKARGAGTGLGLAVARTIVEEHGGRIEAENLASTGNGRRGARFRLILPLSRTPEPAHA